MARKAIDGEQRPVVIDDVHAASLRLSDLGKIVAGPTAEILRELILSWAASRGWEVISYGRFASWARTEMSPDSSWYVADPLYPPTPVSPHIHIIRTRRAGGASAGLLTNVTAALKAHPLAQEASILDDAAFSGTTLCSLVEAIQSLGLRVRAVMLAASSRSAHERVMRLSSNASWATYIDGYCKAIHLRDICPCLPFAGHASRDRDCLMTEAGVVRIVLPAFLAAGSVWEQLGHDRNTRREFVSAVAGFVESFSHEIGRPARLSDVPLLGAEIGFPVFPKFEVTADTPLDRLIEPWGWAPRMRAVHRPSNDASSQPKQEGCGLSAAEVAAELEARLEEEAGADRFSGAVMITKLDSSGRVSSTLLARAFGFSERVRRLPNELSTRFRIGSMNKMFTAVAVLQLAEHNRVNLNSAIGEYIPDYPNQEVAAKVTIHHLLTHTGGTRGIFGPLFQKNRSSLRSLADYVALYGERAPAFEPGTRFAYSNYGMILLGVLIERVTRMTYYEYVTRNVFHRAGMERTGSEPEELIAADCAIGYMRDDIGLTWTENTRTLPYRGTSAGGGYSTVEDLTRFAGALLSCRLLNAEYTNLLLDGKVRSTAGRMYAYGFDDERHSGGAAVGHGGGAPGMSGDLRMYPRSGYVVAALSNLDHPAANQVASFFDLWFPQ